LVKEEEERPEDCIPDLPENQAAREFLAKAPTKGLWMPLGKEVKVMKCWRCKTYGHRTGDKECPLFLSGNREAEQFRFIHEDPMYEYINDNQTKQKELKVQQLKALLEDSSSSSSSTTNSSSSSDSSDSEESETSSDSSDDHKKKSKRKRHRHKSRNKHKKRERRK
jgi:retinitis pigmentosa 9 protein